jgi:hydrogenase expression/formation protein HypE
MKDIITLSHGSGGKMTHKLINEIFHTQMKNDILIEKGDSAILENIHGKLAFTTDSYVITPIKFPGGDIGKIAVCGTVNDLAVSGAKPLYLSCGFIIEEGLEIEELKGIVTSMVKACEEADVKIVTGDTKVVPKGTADKIFINTAGIGVISEDHSYSTKRISPNDKVLISGNIGDHEATILIARENFNVKAKLESDCAPLNNMIQDLVNKFGEKIHVMRDVTRGGLASTLNEFIENTNLSIKLYEDKIPLSNETNGLCEMLGLDPLYMANEGKITLIVDPTIAGDVVEIMRGNVYGRNATVIGEVIEDNKGKVYMKTNVGGTRLIDMLTGEQLPRIC